MANQIAQRILSKLRQSHPGRCIRAQLQRRGLTSLLDAVESGNVEKVVVTYRDRLERFGIDLLERTFRKHGTTFDAREQTSKEPNKNLQKICSQFVTTSWPNTTEDEPLPMLEIDKKGVENPQHVQHMDAEKNNKGVRNRVLTRKINSMYGRRIGFG